MRLCVAAAAMLILAGGVDTAENFKGSLAAIRAVGPDGKGSAAAATAWRELSQADVGQLPLLLAGMDGASSLARNWLRSAIDQVLERSRTANRPLPTAALQEFLLDTRHDPQARRLAYELILEQDRSAVDRFLPGMLDDPSPELRRDAVARLLDEADKVQGSDRKADLLPLFEKALAAARDRDQIDRAARKLRDLGRTIDLARQLGFVLDWKVLGPFPNDKGQGIDSVYPPEKAIDLAATYDGAAGKTRWKDYYGPNEQGVIDFNEAIGPLEEGTGYAWTEFTSPTAQDVEIRMGCYNAFKLWVNGALVLARGDAYTGMRPDHYVARGRLQQGKNTLLLKLCKEVPPGPVPKHWRFQLRVCDAQGVAVLSTTRPAGKPAG